MRNDNEVIAVLVAGYDDDGGERATVILRDANGNVSMRQMAMSDTQVQRAAMTDRFRRGKPIVDPVSREVVGYELERLALPH
jgi:hypothetical protein